MALLSVAPTKSNLLGLRRQLAFAEEGYDLLDQKRQILILELMSRLARARKAERDLEEALRRAFAALREATLDEGSAALERCALAVAVNHEASVSAQRLMGLRLPRLKARIETPGARFGVGGTSANAEEAMRRFAEVLPILAELAELENAVLRLAAELRKTQRRCNALSKTLIPNYRQTIGYVAGSLEERERESLVVLKMIRDRLARSR